LKKALQKLLRAGLGTCGVFNRHRWWRLTTPQVPKPARKSFLVTFFQKSNFFSHF